LVLAISMVGCDSVFKTDAVSTRRSASLSVGWIVKAFYKALQRVTVDHPVRKQYLSPLGC
jgi:hypothetical protein